MNFLKNVNISDDDKEKLTPHIANEAALAKFLKTKISPWTLKKLIALEVADHKRESLIRRIYGKYAKLIRVRELNALFQHCGEELQLAGEKYRVSKNEFPAIQTAFMCLDCGFDGIIEKGTGCPKCQVNQK